MIKTKKTRTITHVHPASLQFLIDVSWDFANSHLWNGKQFDEATVEKAKLFIRVFYRAIPAEQFTDVAAARLKVFCDRVMLGKKYFSRFPYRNLPEPSAWFNNHNKKGFRLTKKWYERGKVIKGKPIPDYIPPGTGVFYPNDKPSLCNESA
jgi:hypothetical protein